MHAQAVDGATEQGLQPEFAVPGTGLLFIDQSGRSTTRLAIQASLPRYWQKFSRPSISATYTFTAARPCLHTSPTTVDTQLIETDFKLQLVCKPLEGFI